MTLPVSPVAESLSRRVASAGYPILGLATILPVLDYFFSISPLHPDTAAWRFGAIGVLASYSMGTVVELFLLTVLALAANHRRVAVVLGVIAALLAVTLLGAGLVFILDALQTRARVNPAAVHQFDVAAGEALLKLFLFGLASAWLARTALKRPPRELSARSRPTPQGIPIISRQLTAERRPDVGVSLDP